jgi:hypothetical protein
MIGLFPKSSTREVTCSRLQVGSRRWQVAGGEEIETDFVLFQQATGNLQHATSNALPAGGRVAFLKNTIPNKYNDL